MTCECSGMWASLDILDAVDRCNDAIGVVVYDEGDFLSSDDVYSEREKVKHG